MLEIFLHPDSAQADLRVLDRFIDWVNHSVLPTNTKVDAIKILESLRFVKVNLQAIKKFVNNKNDYLDKLPEADSVNGVIRDHIGTSLHFNSYATGDHAVNDLSTLIQVFENTFTSLSEANQSLVLLAFISKCNYDKDKGCLEARVANAMEFAGILRDSGNVLRLNDLLAIAQLFYFINIDNDDTYNFIMAEQFFSPFYQQVVINNGQMVQLTEDMVFEALENILSYPKPSTEKLALERSLYQTDFIHYRAQIFAKLTQKATKTIGRAGMIQYRFNTQEDAEQFSKWVKRWDDLQSYNIYHCRAI